MAHSTRRHFIQQAAAVTAAPSLLAGTNVYGKTLGANDRIRVAVIGCNGRGKSHMGGFMGQPNVEVAYVVDLDARVLAGAEKRINDKAGGKYTCKGVADIRKVLEDKNVDAISIAAPNHWHSLMTIWGAQAGKHVYVEKPMSHDVAEGRICVEAQKKYGVVIQHGTQRRSDAGVAGLSEAIRAGKFGRLKISYGYCCKPRGSIGTKATGTPPANLNWDLWRGPASIDDYHANYVHYNWHWFWATGNGDLNNQGTHQLDVAAWAIDADQTHPVKTFAMGGRFNWNDQGETPNTMFALAEYPNGQSVYFNVRNVNYKGYQRQVENEYYFEDGGKIIRGQYYAKGSSKGERVSVPASKNVTPGGNWGSFIAAIRAGKPEMANGNVHEAHYGCVLGHVMNNSYRLGCEVPFNAKAGKFGDDKDAYEHFMKLHTVMTDAGVPENEAKYIVGPTLNFDPKTETFTGEHAKAANVLLKDPNRKGYEIPTAANV